jgi:Spy/CpxP family protein refolding chaperone
MDMSMRRVIITVMISSSILCAQRGRGGFEQRGPSGVGTGAPPTPAQLAQSETERLTRFFSLTSTQQSEVLGILTTADTQIEALAAQIQPLRTTLESVIKVPNSQTQISSTIVQISSLQEQEEVIRANTANQIYTTVLTPTQQAQIGTGLGPLMDAGSRAGGSGGLR